MSRIELHEITKVYHGTIALHKSNLVISEGMFVSLLGPSGCGKTTTLRLIAGLCEPSGGKMLIGDQVVFDLNQKIYTPPEKRNMGMVFQSYALWPHMTVFQNVAYPLKIQKHSKQHIQETVQTFLALVHLSGLEHRYPHELSGGQQQRVALARALIRKPEVLLLDEPLSNLDAKLRKAMCRELRDLQQRLKITTVYVTHDQQEALWMSDKVVLMNQGRIDQLGTPQELAHQPKSEFAKDFLSSRKEV